MLFNFPLFSRLVERAYKNIECSYSLEDVISVFHYYFQKYEDTFKQVHPNIRLEQIEKIINAMPYLGKSELDSGDLTPEEYITLIDKHFQTQYRNCNYRINHFFSGDIRLMRHYEMIY